MPATNSNPMPAPDATDVCPQLSADQEAVIHLAACELMTAEVCRRPARVSDPTLAGAADVVVMGAFVTAKRRGRLRGCCGVLGKPIRILDALQNSAARTATQDVRLPPISPSELAHLDIDVTLLYGFRDVTSHGAERIKDVQVGKHGLQIQRGNEGGLLLPSVPVENHWDEAEFLKQVCRKARLPVTAWQDDNTRLRTFEGSMIEGKFASDALPPPADVATLVISPREIRPLAAYVASNLSALLSGATPAYYATGISDGTVNGIAITIRQAGQNQSQHLGQISMRPGIPLQSSLFSLTEMAARIVRSSAASSGGRLDIEVGLTVLTDTAMQGTVASPDFDGFDPKTRALLLRENEKSVWIFEPAKSAEQILESLTKDSQVVNPLAASLFSMAAVSTENAVTVSNVPQPKNGPSIRPAAVAGTFYPSDADELGRLVDTCFAKLPQTSAKHWPAVMVPHAGLKFSGRIAAEVFQQVQIPDTVIVIGPKHTRLGVPWAVAPHERWSIPGATIESDRKLAEELVAEIPDLVFDAAAHEKEHGIEVELPLLARVSPKTRVVGITIGAGDFDKCLQIAAGLTRVMKRQKSQPLLVISSDMNHFATDEENRRLDEMALASLDKRDPAVLYKTVTSHNISMCGVLPAVIVLETLRQLGTLKKSQRVAYGTSADVTGDTSRVVGYAGMIFG